jgi:hypothetical protein
MNPGVERGERLYAVRDAAASWQRAGLIDEATRAAIDATYADDRQRVGTAVRVLLFIFAWIAAQSASGFFMMFAQGRGIGVISLFFGVVCAVACELLRNRLRWSRSGAEEAAGLMAVSFLVGGLGWIVVETIHDDGQAFVIGCAVAAALALAAAWRWGGAIYGVAAAAGIFLVLVRFPAVRWTWLGLTAIAAAPLVRLGESARLAPTQRPTSPCTSAFGTRTPGKRRAPSSTARATSTCRASWRSRARRSCRSCFSSPVSPGVDAC